MSVVRSFIAIELPDVVKNELASAQSALKKALPGYRWVSTATLHLTLKFLGELEQATFDRLAGELEAGVEVGGPLELSASGLGGFPNPARARVVWAGLAGDTARLGRLFMAVEARLEKLGLPREPRAFKPHLTLGRAKRGGRGANIQNAVDRLGGFQSTPWRADELILFESILEPGGARHLPRARAPIL